MNYPCDVSIVIVNYNGKKYIDALFSGLINLKHSDFSYEIVFVDNASSDDSIEYLNNNYGSLDNLVVVKSKDNLGFAGGNNLGVSKAKGEYIVLLNNDTKPESDWLEELYHYIRAKKDVVMANSKLVFFYDFFNLKFHTQDKIIIGRNIKINDKEYKIDNKFCTNALCEEDRIVCFGHTNIYIPFLYGEEEQTVKFRIIKATDSDRIIQDEKYPVKAGEEFCLKFVQDGIAKTKKTLIQNAGSGINDKLDGFDIGFAQEDGEKYQSEYEISNGCGASIIFKKEDFMKCGGFDERFFMYYEDTDLSFRMKKNGGKIMYCPSSVVRHIHTGSSGEWSPFFVFHVCRNKLLFIAKNFGMGKFFKYYILQTLSAIKHRDRNNMKGTQAALGMLVKKNTVISYK